MIEKENVYDFNIPDTILEKRKKKWEKLFDKYSERVKNDDGDDDDDDGSVSLNSPFDYSVKTRKKNYEKEGENLSLNQYYLRSLDKCIISLNNIENNGNFNKNLNRLTELNVSENSYVSNDSSCKTIDANSKLNEDISMTLATDKLKQCHLQNQDIEIIYEETPKSLNNSNDSSLNTKLDYTFCTKLFGDSDCEDANSNSDWRSNKTNKDDDSRMNTTNTSENNHFSFLSDEEDDFTEMIRKRERKYYRIFHRKPSNSNDSFLKFNFDCKYRLERNKANESCINDVIVSSDDESSLVCDFRNLKTKKHREKK